jgi:ribonuclease D
MTSEEILLLPSYPGIPFTDICLVRTESDIERAYAAMSAADVLGFDTESKPVFFKGQQSDGPHLIQLATDTEVFLFPVLQPTQIKSVQAVLESKQILKVGFGLGDDNKRLHAKLGIIPANVLDLSRAMRESKQRDMGAKAAVAKFFGMKLQKSKKTSTSNWAAAALSERQLQYAADDAQVALLVYRKWLAQKAGNG